MSNRVVEESQFLNNVSQHEMVIIKDDGVYRHIRFKKPGSMCMHFDLITWPGYLSYTGDMGSYVFSRLEDMFEFFRTDREHMHLRDGKTLAINPGYWAEKVQASDRNDGLKEFSEAKFERVVLEDLISWIRDYRDRTTKEERRELWERVLDDVLGADGDNGGFRKQAAAHDFYHLVNKDVGRFRFVDFGEHTVDEYTFRYIWCCYALAWGIEKYDEAKGVA